MRLRDQQNKKVTDTYEMFKMDVTMKKLGFLALLVFISAGLWANKSYAQSNAELQAAIDGGPGAVRDFYSDYADNASGLAGLDPSLIEQSVQMSGGIENLINADGGILQPDSPLNLDQATDFLDALNGIGSTDSAITAAGLLTAISQDDSVLGEALTSGLGADFFEDLEGIIPDLPAGISDIISDLFGLDSLSDLFGGLGGLFGDGSGSAIGSIIGGLPSGSLLGAAATGSSSTALPTATPMSPTCDSDILVAMETRAWLEAQREITQNQNLIAKPDSVLEYTCFDSFLDVLAEQASTMFSENTDAWSGSIPISDSDMDNALNSLVGTAANAYVATNFSHSFIGGRGTDDYVPDTISGAAYTCDVMNNVWMNAKCMNFSSRPEDGFWTFEQHASNIARTLPEECGPEARWDPYIEATFESPAWRPPFTGDVEAAYTTAGEYTEPGECETDRSIRTGLTIFDDGDELDDTVCLNPGCFFDGSECVAF